MLNRFNNKTKFNAIKNNPYEAVVKISDFIKNVIFSRISDCITVKSTNALNKRRAKVTTFAGKNYQAKHYVNMETLAGEDHNGLYNRIMPYDSVEPEKDIIINAAKQMLINQEPSIKEITVFTKFPTAVNIPTPIHKQGINPDFGFVVKQENGSLFYLIAEAKPTLNTGELRAEEQYKVKFLKKYFESLGASNIRYKTVASYQDVV